MPKGSVALTASLPGGGLDEVGARHHRHDAGAGHVPQGAQLPGSENRLEMGRTGRSAEGLHLVVERGPVGGEHVGAGDDDVDLPGAGRHRGLDLGDPQPERREPGGKSGGHRGHRNAAPLEGPDRRLHEGVVDAHRGHREAQVSRAQRLQQILAHRMARLGAEAQDPPGRVVARQRREIDQRDGAEQPARLPGGLDRAASRNGGRAAFHRAPIDPDVPDPPQIERHAGVPRKRRRRLRGRGRSLRLGGPVPRGLGRCRHDSLKVASGSGYVTAALNILAPRPWRRPPRPV